MQDVAADRQTDRADVTERADLVLPGQANHYGTLFAGQALSLMASAAFTAASRHARHDMVLTGVDTLRLDAPVPVGSLFVTQARLQRRGRSSVTISVTGICENPRSGHRTQVAQGQFRLVAVDLDGRPQPITDRSSADENP